jgi:hypothetical protein
MKREILLLTFISLLILMTACGAPESNSANTANGNANVAAGNANHPTMPIPRNDEATFNDAPTIGPTIQKYYEALKNKDDAAVRDTLSADFLKTIQDDMKDQKRTDLAAFLAETDYRPGQVIETRNEKIEGDKATAELRGGAYKNWTTFTFAKENGKWKFTGGSPDIDTMPKSNSNAVSPH